MRHLHNSGSLFDPVTKDSVLTSCYADNAGRVARVPGTAGLWHLVAPEAAGCCWRLERGEAWRSAIGATEVRAWNP